MIRVYKQVVFLGLLGFGLNANAASIPFDFNGRIDNEVIFSSESDDGFWVQANQWVIRGGRIILLTHSLDLSNNEPPDQGVVQFSANHDHNNGTSLPAHPNPNFPNNVFPFEDFPISVFPSEHYPEHFDELPYPWAQPTVVPVPAAIWLFGSGLMGLFTMSRRKRKDNH